MSALIPRFETLRGDSLVALRSLASESVDGVVTDPPFSSGGAFRGDRARATGDKYVLTGVKLERPDFEGDTRDQRGFRYWMILILLELLRVAKRGAPIVLVIDWRQLPTLTDALQAAGWVWRGISVWDKTEGIRPVMGRFAAQAEFLVWGSKGAHPQLESVGCLPGVFRFSRDAEARIHQTGKPVSLMAELVRIVPPGGLVLDPFMGSGSTGIAALRMDRRFLGIEVTEEWHAIARERLEAESNLSNVNEQRGGQVALFGSEGARG